MSPALPFTLETLELETGYYVGEQKPLAKAYSEAIKQLHFALGDLQGSYVERFGEVKTIPGVTLERGRNVAVWGESYEDATTREVAAALEDVVPDFDPNEFATQAGSISENALVDLVKRHLDLTGEFAVKEAREILVGAGVGKFTQRAGSLALIPSKTEKTSVAAGAGERTKPKRSRSPGVKP